MRGGFVIAQWAPGLRDRIAAGDLDELVGEILAVELERPVPVGGAEPEAAVEASSWTGGRAKRSCRTAAPSRLPTFAEIGYGLGYGDPANFSTAFKRWTGKSPSALRKAAKG